MGGRSTAVQAGGAKAAQLWRWEGACTVSSLERKAEGHSFVTSRGHTASLVFPTFAFGN